MTFNINAPSYVPPKVKLKKTYNLVFGNISAIKIAYFIPTRFFRATGTLQFDEIEWKYQLAKGIVEGYSILIAISHEYKVCLKALYDSYNGYFYGSVIPMCHMSQDDRDIYLSNRLKQIYNPNNRKWISPCSYGKNLSHLFIMRRKQGKSSFKPLPKNPPNPKTPWQTHEKCGHSFTAKWGATEKVLQELWPFQTPSKDQFVF